MENMDFLPPSAPNLIFECETYMAYWHSPTDPNCHSLTVIVYRATTISNLTEMLKCLRCYYLQTAQTGANAGVVLLSRISESTTGYTFTPCVWSFTSSGIDTR